MPRRWILASGRGVVLVGWELLARGLVACGLAGCGQVSLRADGGAPGQLGTYFQSWYSACGDNCVRFTGPNSLTWLSNNGTTGTIATFDQGCGSVHFPPNARASYDDQNAFGVLSTCEHYGLHDGPGGADLQETFTDARSQRYDAGNADCERGWQVYWRQSFPGYQNPAKDAAGAAMKNWWVYEFY